MTEKRIAIIGTGLISHRHMKVWSQIPGAKVVCAAEIDSKKLEAWRLRYGFDEKDCYADFREMLKRDDIDAVDVCVHNNLHAPVAIAVMRAGYPCYSEKPMAGCYADAKAMYDASKSYGVKFAVQISSIYNYQTRLAKQMVENGDLGHVYYGQIIGGARRRRPGIDLKGGFSMDFFRKEIAAHGPVIDGGIYSISRMMWVLGLPELDYVTGIASTQIPVDHRLTNGEENGVEDFATCLAMFKGGFTFNMMTASAINMDDSSSTYIAGSKGGLKFIGLDAFGGKLSAPEMMARMPLNLTYYGDDNGRIYHTDLECAYNENMEELANPKMAVYNDNQRQWLAILNDEVTEETRIPSPIIAMNTALISDGLFLSSALGRSVTADEIKSLVGSLGVRRQETEWGVIEYDF